MVHGRTQSATIDFSSISATSNNNLSTTTNSPLRHHSSCDTIQQQQNVSSGSSAAAVVSSMSGTVNNNNNNNNNNNSGGTNAGGGTNGLQISQQLFHVMSHLSDQQLSELRDVFCLFDSSGDGELDPEEFSQLLLALMSKQEPFNEENGNNNSNNNSSSNNNSNNNNSSSSSEHHHDDENNSNNSNNNSDDERKRHARLLSRELVIEADSSGNGLVDFCEFLTLVTRMVTEVSSVKEAFEVLNMNHNSTTTTNSTTNRNNNNTSTNNNNTTTATTTSSFTSSSMGSEDTSQILSRTLQSEEQSLLNSDVGRQSISGDDGSSGATVPLSVFKHAMTTMGERFSEEEVDAMWQELGLDPEADLPIDLFIKYCMSN